MSTAHSWHTLGLVVTRLPPAIRGHLRPLATLAPHRPVPPFLDRDPAVRTCSHRSQSNAFYADGIRNGGASWGDPSRPESRRSSPSPTHPPRRRHPRPPARPRLIVGTASGPAMWPCDTGTTMHTEPLHPWAVAVRSMLRRPPSTSPHTTRTEAGQPTHRRQAPRREHPTSAAEALTSSGSGTSPEALSSPRSGPPRRPRPRRAPSPPGFAQAGQNPAPAGPERDAEDPPA